MSTVPLMFQPLVKYVDFGGRARRSEYWLWVLFQIIAAMFFASIQAMFMTDKSTLLVVVGIRLLFQLAILLPTIAVSVRRFHDIGRTGWWVVFPLVVMIVAITLFCIFKGWDFIASLKGLGALSNAPPVSPAHVLVLVMTLLAPLMLWIFLPTWLAEIVTFVFNVIEGTAGPNRYGLDPKGRGNISVF